MALGQPIASVGFCKAAATMASNQYKCVKVTADATFNICTAAGEAFLGVLQDTPPSGSPGNIMTVGVTRIVVGTGDLAAGAAWETAADGTGITAATGKVGAGIVLIGAAAGKFATVTVGMGNVNTLA